MLYHFCHTPSPIIGLTDSRMADVESIGKNSEDMEPSLSASLDDDIKDNSAPEEDVSLDDEDEEDDDSMPSLMKAFKEKVRPFIDLIDRLRHYGLDKDVGLPAVVVIGDQSAGKSSTLEAISGVQLPRGSGIVTRCPLELRLKSNPQFGFWKGRISYTKKGETISHQINNAEDVGEEVLGAQNALAGRHKGITHDLISLEVEANGIPDLTLIDLPGITRVAVQDQPEDIGDQIKALINSYIRKKETIILAVVPANVDVATTEALKLAIEMDPHGERTLGVVTKPDLIDRGTEAELIAVVNNQRFNLKKGYTVVKCRGQTAINDGQSLPEAMREEQRFFANHDSLSELDPLLCGIKNLSNKLTDELVNQIKTNLPSLKEEIKVRLFEAHGQFEEMGQGLPAEPAERTLFLVNLLDSYLTLITKLCKGEYFPKDGSMRLYTYARQSYVEFAENVVELTPGAEDDIMIDRIQEEIDDQRGRELPRVWKFSILEMFIVEHIKAYQEPAYKCVSQVNSFVERVLGKLSTDKLARFPKLEMVIKSLVNEIRADAFLRCMEKVKETFAMESMVFTQDKFYLKKLEKLQKAKRKAEDEQENEIKSGHQVRAIHFPKVEIKIYDKKSEAKAMYEAIYAYLQVATTRLVDTIPMICNYQMLDLLAAETRKKILSLITQTSTLAFLEEDTMVAHRRLQLEQKIDRLNHATKELSKF